MTPVFLLLLAYFTNYVETDGKTMEHKIHENTYFSSYKTVSSNRILYTPSSFARSSLLYIQEVGELEAIAPHTSKRHNLDSYLCFVVTAGSGRLKYNGIEYPLKTGDCVFIDCRNEYSHTTDVDLWNLCWVHFYGAALPAIYHKYAERGGMPVFTPANGGSILALVREIMQIAASSDHIKDMYINEKLACLLTLLMNESWHPEKVSHFSSRANLQEIKNYLDTHYRQKITLDELAALFYIDKYYLTRIFKRCFGVTIQSYLLEKRITHAKQLLRFSDKTVEEIAFECGFGDVRYFCRVFKKAEGGSPGTYRKKWLN